jgi:hypothetical protein
MKTYTEQNFSVYVVDLYFALTGEELTIKGMKRF